MRSGSFLSEKIIGWLIGSGVVGILLGGYMITGGRRGRIYRYSTDLETINFRTHVGETIVVIGAVVALIGLIAGLMIAYGLGPSRRLYQVLVEERMVTLSDGTPVFSDIPEGEPLKYYLRMRTTDGEVFEARCAPEVFYAVKEQSIGNAKVAGEKLISFMQTGMRHRV